MYTLPLVGPLIRKRFYTKQSSLSHGVEGDLAQTFVGQKVRHHSVIPLIDRRFMIKLSLLDLTSVLSCYPALTAWPLLAVGLSFRFWVSFPIVTSLVRSLRRHFSWLSNPTVTSS